MWEYLGRGFTEIERTPNADLAPYMNISRLDQRFYDLEKAPLLETSAPTMKQARLKSLRARPAEHETAENDLRGRV